MVFSTHGTRVRMSTPCPVLATSAPFAVVAACSAVARASCAVSGDVNFDVVEGLAVAFGADVHPGQLSGQLSPLFWTHINPYGRFRLDMDTRLDLTAP